MLILIFLFKKSTYIWISFKLGRPRRLCWDFAAGRATCTGTCLGLQGHSLSRGLLCPEVLWLPHHHQQERRPVRSSPEPVAQQWPLCRQAQADEASFTAEGLWAIKRGGGISEILHLEPVKILNGKKREIPLCYKNQEQTSHLLHILHSSAWWQRFILLDAGLSSCQRDRSKIKSSKASLRRVLFHCMAGITTKNQNKLKPSNFQTASFLKTTSEFIDQKKFINTPNMISPRAAKDIWNLFEEHAMLDI